MKLRATKTLLTSFGHACNYAYNVPYVEKTTQMFMRTALESLIVMFARHVARISQALTLHPEVISTRKGVAVKKPKEKIVMLNLSPADVFVLKIACEEYMQANPDAIESIFLNQYFISPITALNV